MGTMPYELNVPMWFGRAGFGDGIPRRPVHFTDGDCRTCGGECKHPELAAQPEAPGAKHRYPKIRRARLVDADDAKKPGLTPRKIDAE